MQPNDEVIYTIMVIGLTDTGKRQQAHATLAAAGVPAQLRHERGDTIHVPRLFTRWLGDETERVWQQGIKAALPSAIIDVQPWSYAPGYPKGDLTL